jgi:hypothetical protein
MAGHDDRPRARVLGRSGGLDELDLVGDVARRGDQPGAIGTHARRWIVSRRRHPPGIGGR